MGKPRLALVLVCLLAAALAPARASAQIYEVVGTRAQGMGGAFTAVADDATATWWNPAGIGLTYFSFIAEHGQTDEPGEPAPLGPAWEGRTSAFAASFPALGLSYYRLRISEIAPRVTTAEGEAGRQDLGADGVSLRAFSTQQYGVTFGQSLGNHLIVATTLRLVRAGRVRTIGNALGDADQLDVPLENSGDIDMGVMAVAGLLRFGASVKHLREPDFGDGVSRFILKRQARAGVAWSIGQPGALAKMTVAGDGDLTRTPTAFGDARHIAAGAEFTLPGPHIAVRGGFSANTINEWTHSGSIGGGVGVSRGFYFDGAATFGSDNSRKGWSVTVRLAL